MYQETKSVLMEELDRFATHTGWRALSTADHLQRIADRLRAEELPEAARLTERGARLMKSVGHYLQENDGEKLIADVEEFGRRRPWTLAGTGLLAGISASRMLKAAASRRGRRRRGEAF